MQAGTFAGLLARLEQDPAQLERERQLRFSGSPPPPYASVETSTAPPSLPPAETPPLDTVEQQHLIEREYAASVPFEQFAYQARKLHERLNYQYDHYPRGRKETLRVELRIDTEAHAENLVRERWISQGIWQPSWGPRWPPETGLSGFSVPVDGPRHVGTDWKSKDTGAAGNDTTDCKNDSSSSAAPGKGENNEQFRYSATRPLQQFLAQLPDERQWIKDELRYKGEEPELDINTIELDTLTFQSLRESWVDQGIWRSHWKVVPGDEWLHESMDFETYRRQRDQLVVRRQDQEDEREDEGEHILPPDPPQVNNLNPVRDRPHPGPLFPSLPPPSGTEPRASASAAEQEAPEEQRQVDVPAPAERPARGGRRKKQPTEDTQTVAPIIHESSAQPRRSQRVRDQTSPHQVKGNNHSRLTPAKRTRNTTKKAQASTPASTSKPEGITKRPRGRPRKVAAKK